MSAANEFEALRKRLAATQAGMRIALLKLHPAKLLLLGYLFYIAIGWAVLSLPWSHEVGQSLRAIDTLFIATSAVSTTGLVSIDPATSFSNFGEVVILLLFQVGGLGYMTIGSFATLSLVNRLSGLQVKATKAAFNLPDTIDPKRFLISVVVFTLVCEAIGAAALWAMFTQAGLSNPLWSAIFHSVSAFCTAGFSLNSNSFEGFRNHAGVNIVISLLSILGAMGFLVIVDLWRTLAGEARHLGFTSKVIFRSTVLLLLAGTALLFIIEPTVEALEPSERLLAAFFQAMTATTTVGFNTHPISGVGHAALIVLFFLMIVGASPAGTGGGLKTTTLAALVGLVRSTVKGRDRIRLDKRQIPLARLQAATAAFVYYFGVLGVALLALFLTEPAAAFETVVFEAISALGTVGLSMGLTSDLSDLGKLVVIVLMTAGRVGILTFGIALAMHDETPEEEADNDLVV